MTRLPLLTLSLLCCGPALCAAGCGDDGGGNKPPVECAQEDGWVVWEQCCEQWGELEEGGTGCYVPNDQEIVAGFCICFLEHDCDPPEPCAGYTDTDVDTDTDTDTDTGTDAVDCEW